MREHMVAKHGSHLSSKLHGDVVAEEENALPCMDEHAAVGVGCVQGHPGSLWNSETVEPSL